MFARNEEEEVIQLSRELLPASITAASVLIATDTGILRDPANLVVEIAGRISRKMAKSYLDGAASARRPKDFSFFVATDDDAVAPPYGPYALREEDSESFDCLNEEPEEDGTGD